MISKPKGKRKAEFFLKYGLLSRTTVYKASYELSKATVSVSRTININQA